MASIPPPPGAPIQVSQGNGLAVAGFVTGLVGAAIGLGPALLYIVPLACGIVGLVLSGIGVARGRAPDRSGFKLGIAGVILSAVAVALGIYGASVVNDAFSDVSRTLGGT